MHNRHVAALIALAVVLGTLAVGGGRDPVLHDSPSTHAAEQLVNARALREILPAPDEVPDSSNTSLNTSEPTMPLRCCSMRRPLALPDAPPTDDEPPPPPAHAIETPPG